MAFRRALFTFLAVFTALLTVVLLLAGWQHEQDYRASAAYRRIVERTGEPFDPFDAGRVALVGGGLAATFGLLAWRNDVGTRRARWEQDMLDELRRDRREE